MKEIEQKQSDIQDPSAAAQPPETPARDLKEAKKLVRIANYFGIGWLVNSASSLYITYNVLPTKPVQAGISKLKDAIFKVMSAGKAGPQLAYAHDKARSAAEILTMCISGTLLLLPMGLIARNEDKLASKLDRFLHPGKYRTPEACAQAMQDESQPQQDRVGWGQLLAARAAGIGTNLTVDQMIEGFNNHRDAKGLPNFDTMEWKAGNAVYDKLPARTRDGLLNFFDGHKAGINSIQPTVQKRLANVVGNDPKRMVFAEQSRLFLKEFVLTLLLAGVVAKVSTAKFFGKKKEGDFSQEVARPQAAFIADETQDDAPEEKSFRKKFAPAHKHTELAQPSTLGAERA